ncbi:MAG: hypothetical protein RL154_651 [Pseudomonadota bacterium]
MMLLFSMQIFAQENIEPTPNVDDKAKLIQTIDALKVAYITKELNLTPDEAQKFWPVYNGFANEIKKAKVEFKQDDIAFAEKRVVIMKKYKDDFKKVLNNDSRANKCFRVEPEFHKLLRNEWQRRQGVRQQHHQPEIKPQLGQHPNKLENGGSKKGGGRKP